MQKTCTECGNELTKDLKRPAGQCVGCGVPLCEYGPHICNDCLEAKHTRAHEEVREPSEDQIAEYRADKALVEAHRGQMHLMEYECAGKNPAFTECDMEAMIKSVLATNPDLELDRSWNGAGHYSASVGCRYRTAKEDTHA